MSFNAHFTVSGDALRAEIVARIERLKHQERILEISGAIARDAAKVRIRTEGRNLDPPWIPSLKTRSMTFAGKHGLGLITIQGSGGKTGYDLGTMSNSIEYRVEPPSRVVIGTNVPYARYFQEGTGIYVGHAAWTIRPRVKRALSWVYGGRRFFAREVTIKGQPPRPFLLFEEADIKAIMSAWQRYVAGAVA